MIYLIDLFCGFGGTTQGASKVPGVKVIACVNHDPLAIKSHEANHPDCIHYIEDIKVLDLTELVELVAKIRREDPDAKIALWASLECINHSNAKSGMSRDADSRTLAEHLIESEDLYGNVQQRYIPLLQPDVVYIENVREFMQWGPLEVKVTTHIKKVPVAPFCPLDYKTDKEMKIKSLHPVWVPVKDKKGVDFEAWKNKIKALGYEYEDRVLNAADFGAFTSRRRYFAQFAKPGFNIAFPEPTHADRRLLEKGKVVNLRPWKPVRDVLRLDIHGKSIFGRKRKNGSPANLSDKTYERIYHGLLKFVAGGKDAFLVKWNSVDGATGKYVPPGIDDPCPTVSTQNRLGIASAQFVVNYHHSSNSESIDEPTGSVTTKDKKALTDVQFIDKAFSGSPEHKSSSIENPGPTVKCIDNSSQVTVQFINKYHSGDPDSKNESIDNPAPVVRTKDGASLVSSEFIQTYHGTGDNYHSVDGPSPTIPTHDSAALIQAEQFVMNNYTGGGQVADIDNPTGSVMPVCKSNLISTEQFVLRDFSTPTNQSVEEPSGAITTNPKSNLVSATPFVMDTQCGNGCQSLDEPSPTQTANRKHFYLVNPQYVNDGASIDKPCFTLIARMDKAPPYIVMAEDGRCAIQVEDGDTPHMIKIKEFMAMYGIVDIKMRMFLIKELLQIQGFSSNYKMFGTQTDQKRFIGNAVEVTQAEALFIASVNANVKQSA